MNLSETYDLLDCTFYDKGTNTDYNSNWSNYNSNITVERNDEYTTLTPGVNNNQNRFVISSSYIPSQPFVVEFNKYGTNVSGAMILIGSRAITFSSIWNGALASATHIKFTVEDDTISVEHDGITESSTLSITSLSDIQFRFSDLSSGTIKYSDFKIYPI